jgi:molybdopterin converting factor subunit 1
MEINVRYFAAFREATGLETERLRTRATTAAELFKECRARHGALQDYRSSMVAINDEMAAWDSALEDGDEVLFFPPVAGG